METVPAHTKMTVEVRFEGKKRSDEGEAKMSQPQNDYYQSLIGDGKARVTVSRDEARKDFGNGGGIGVTVSLTCGQTQEQVQGAINLAQQIADQNVRYYGGLVEQDLINRGIIQIKP